MNEFYNQNRGHVRSYCFSARIIGWMLLVVPSIIFTTRLLGPMSFGRWRWIYTFLFSIKFIKLFMLQAVFSFPNFLLPGLLLVGAAQFIRYLYDDGYQPRWLLRHGTTILYTCAIIVLAVYIGGLVQRFNYITGIDAIDFSRLSSDGLLSALPIIGIILILIGTGQALRRIMPVIEESKTLRKLGTTTGLGLQKTVTDPSRGN